jgi:hypothetical protein
MSDQSPLAASAEQRVEVLDARRGSGGRRGQVLNEYEFRRDDRDGRWRRKGMGVDRSPPGL